MNSPAIRIIIIMTTGIGIILKIYPCPITFIEFGIPYIGIPPHNTKVTPLSTVAMPNVEIKDGTFIFEIKIPFINPIIDAIAIPIIITTIAGNLYRSNKPNTTHKRDITDPMDKSIPPVNNTNVMPTDKIANIDIWRAIFIKLPKLKNAGAIIEKIIINNISINTIANFFIDE